MATSTTPVTPDSVGLLGLLGAARAKPCVMFVPLFWRQGPQLLLEMCFFVAESMTPPSVQVV